MDKYYVVGRENVNVIIKDQNGSLRVFTELEVKEFLKNKPYLMKIKIKV